MRAELQTVLIAVRELPVVELPRLLGELEEIRCIAFARLQAPAPVAQVQPDELLSVEAASAKLGVSRDYLYRHHGKFPFARRMGRKLLFSSQGIQKYIEKR